MGVAFGSTKEDEQLLSTNTELLSSANRNLAANEMLCKDESEVCKFISAGDQCNNIDDAIMMEKCEKSCTGCSAHFNDPHKALAVKNKMKQAITDESDCSDVQSTGNVNGRDINCSALKEKGCAAMRNRSTFECAKTCWNCFKKKIRKDENFRGEPKEDGTAPVKDSPDTPKVCKEHEGVLGETKPFCTYEPTDPECKDQLPKEVCDIICSVGGFARRPARYKPCMKTC